MTQSSDTERRKTTLTHDDIKNAVSESLAEALQITSAKKEENSGLRWFIDVAGKTVPLVIVALLSWICVTIVDVQREIALTQKDIVALRLSIKVVDDRLLEHNVSSNESRMKNAVVHHVDYITKCNACHQTAQALNTLKKNKQTK